MTDISLSRTATALTQSREVARRSAWILATLTATALTQSRQAAKRSAWILATQTATANRKTAQPQNGRGFDARLVSSRAHDDRIFVELRLLLLLQFQKSLR
jgi:hypothetical protein